MTCISGPPCRPGKTAELIAFACSARSEDQAAARTAQRLVRGAGHEVGDADGRRIDARRRSGPRSAPCRPSAARRRRRRSSRKRFQSMTREYADAPATISFGLCSCASRSACVVVDELGLRIEPVGDDVEPLAANVDRRAVRQVPAVRQAHAEDGVARLAAPRRTRPGWPARPSAAARWRRRAEQLLGAVDRELLGDVDEFAAAVVALARIAFGVLVGELRALRRQHRRAGVVLGRDQLDVVFLPLVFARDRLPELGIGLGERRASGGTWRCRRWERVDFSIANPLLVPVAPPRTASAA